MAITARPIDLESTHGWPRIDLQIPPVFVKNALVAAEPEVVSRTNQKLQAFDELQSQLFRSAAYAGNWDSYGAEPPAPSTVSAAQVLLGEAQTLETLPNTIVASAEGGLAAYFFSPNRTSYIEFYNDGESVLARYGEDVTTVVVQIERDRHSLTRALEAISVFLAADPAHASSSF